MYVCLLLLSLLARSGLSKNENDPSSVAAGLSLLPVDLGPRFMLMWFRLCSSSVSVMLVSAVTRRPSVSL